jgi:hypothetical protein
MIHTCARCKRTYTVQEWEALPGAVNGRDWVFSPSHVLELRNCSCGGTMTHDPLPPILQLGATS